MHCPLIIKLNPWMLNNHRLANFKLQNKYKIRPLSQHLQMLLALRLHLSKVSNKNPRLHFASPIIKLSNKPLIQPISKSSIASFPSPSSPCSRPIEIHSMPAPTLVEITAAMAVAKSLPQRNTETSWKRRSSRRCSSRHPHRCPKLVTTSSVWGRQLQRHQG